MKVFINPGHSPNGKPDPGACNSSTGLRECDVALNISNLLKEYLIDAGVEVVGIMQSDSLDDVTDTANASGADLFISVHCNSAAAEEANGTEVCVYPGSGTGASLGQCIQNQIVHSLGTTDRGLKERVPGINGLFVLNNTDMPAVLVETAFISNGDDEVLLKNNQDDFARAIARGVTDYAEQSSSD